MSSLSFPLCKMRIINNFPDGMWLVAIEKMKASCLARSGCRVNVKFLPPVHQHLLGRYNGLPSTSLPLAGFLTVAHLWLFPSVGTAAQPTESDYWKDTSCPGARHTEEPPLQGQSLMTLQFRACKEVLVFPGCSWETTWFLSSLRFWVFWALVPTLVKGWAAPLRDLIFFSLTLSSQPGITPKHT